MANNINPVAPYLPCDNSFTLSSPKYTLPTGREAGCALALVPNSDTYGNVPPVDLSGNNTVMLIDCINDSFNRNLTKSVVNFLDAGGYVNIPQNDSLYFGAGDFTVRALVCLPKPSTLSQRVFSQGRVAPGGTDGEFCFGFGAVAGCMNFAVNNGGIVTDITTPSFDSDIVIPGAYNELAVTRGAGVQNFFVNGRLVHSQAMALSVGVKLAGPPSPAYPYMIGCRNPDGGIAPRTEPALYGRLQSILVLNGICQYTSNYDPTV